MKVYIMFTGSGTGIGGLELYTAGKAKYLEKCGWKVFVLCGATLNERHSVTYLDKYRDSRFPFITNRPAQLPSTIRTKAIEQLCKYINDNIPGEKETEILIESQASNIALWAEILAEKFGAKHICFNCNETFRGKGKYYEENMDFFIFKYKRGELLGLHTDTLKKLFDGYMEVPDSGNFVFDAVEPEPIQDVYCQAVDRIERYDYNIAYLGRAAKEYVPNIIQGVREFSQIYRNKSVQFIMIGNAECRNVILQNFLGNLPNVKVTLLGDLVPIPRSIYNKIDVMIAGAVCAEISAREKVPTIVADCENFLANGILGYSVNNSMYHDESVRQTGFCEALEEVLIRKDYLKLPYSFPEQALTDEIYASHFDFFKNSDQEKKYYPVSDNKNVQQMPLIKAVIKVKYPKLFSNFCSIKKVLKMK